MSVNSGHKQRLGIYCFYDKYGHAASFIKTFLDDLMDNLDDLVVVVNGQLSDQARQLFSEYTKTIIVRENKGLGNEVGCARIPAYFFGFFSWLFSNMLILFSYYYIDVFGLVRYICLPEHHKTSFFLEKSRRCGKKHRTFYYT